MPNINQKINSLATNIHKMRNSRSVLGIDDQGGLIRVNFKGQVARTLLYLGIGQTGKWGHRLVLYLAGKEQFNLFCQSHQTRYANSMLNLSQLTKKFETRKLDRDLTDLVSTKIDEVLRADNTHLTAVDFIALHTRIRDEIKTHKEAMAQRSSLWKKIDDLDETPTMENATYRGVRIAAAALGKNMEKDIDVHRLMNKADDVDDADEMDEMLAVRPPAPIGVGFAEEVCGKKHNSNILRRDVEDANKILTELKLAELHVQEKVHSDTKKLKSEYKSLLNKIAREGANTSPELVADWELKSHRLKTKIKHDEQHIEDHIKKQVADLKQNLLATLKESYNDRLALSKLTAAEIEAAPKPMSSKREGGLKSALKSTTAQSRTTASDIEVKTKRRIHFGGLETQELEESYLHPGFMIDDSNRTEWVQNIKATLDSDKDPQAPYMIAETLAQRGEHSADDAETVKEISLLRTHPAFLKKNNFAALVINIRAATDEARKFPDKFSDEVKQNYRKNAENFKKLAKQQLETTENLIAKLNSYQAGLKTLDDDPNQREIQQRELNEQLAEYKEEFEAYKSVYEDADPNFTVRYKMQGKLLKAFPQMLSAAFDIQDDIEIMLRRLEGSPLFVDKKP